MTYYVGLDWAAREHAVCVIDERGAVTVRFTVAHSAPGMSELVAKLSKLATPGELHIAIERPSGLLVDTLVDGGFAIVPIHPNIVKSARPRYSAAQGKTDLGDAYLLADLLRTDGHRFRTLSPLSDEIKALRGLVRTRDDLVQRRVATANQLRCLLEEFWPGAAEIFPGLDTTISLDFLERYPTPQSATGLGEKRLAAFLGRHGYSGRRPAAELLERLRNAPVSAAGELEAEAKGECVRALASVLRPILHQITVLTSAIEHAVDAHPDGKIFAPLFRTHSRICIAQLMAEIGDDRARYDSDEHLAAEAGVAPITRESGKRRVVSFRWACNARLRAALTTLADTTRHTNPWARAVYQRARDRGCEHAHATRILARAWCRVLFGCWQKRVPYDISKHRAARDFTLCIVDNEAA